MQNICISIGSNSVHASIFLIDTVQVSVECKTQESEAVYAKHLNLY